MNLQQALNTQFVVLLDFETIKFPKPCHDGGRDQILITEEDAHELAEQLREQHPGHAYTVHQISYGPARTR